MNGWNAAAGQPWLEQLARMHVHFLWQGSLVAGIVAVVLACLSRRRVDDGFAKHRYIVACTGLGLMMLCPVVTWFLLSTRASLAGKDVASNVNGGPRGGAADRRQSSNAPFTRSSSSRQSMNRTGKSPPPAQGEVPAESLVGRVGTWMAENLYWFVVVWLCVVGVRTGWLLIGRCFVWRLQRRALWPITTDLVKVFARLKRNLGVRGKVGLCESPLVSTPTVVGWLSPVVLVPPKFGEGLTGPQVEAVLAHELMHVRRNDNIVLLLQKIVEILLFYHPAVWWLSRRILLEREYCCDDAAGHVCISRRGYARALEHIVLKASGVEIGLTATTGDLDARIARLLNRPRPISLWRVGLLVLGVSAPVVLAGVVLGMPGNGHAADPSLTPTVFFHHLEVRRSPGTITLGPMDDAQDGVFEVTLPANGRRGFNIQLDDERDHVDLRVRVMCPGPVVVQLRGWGGGNAPFLIAKWPTPNGMTSDTDGGSGAGEDCLLFVNASQPPPNNYLECRIQCWNFGHERPQHVLCKLWATVWQPRDARDREADTLGVESVLVLLNKYGHAQVPHRPGARPPAIDFVDDVDTFLVSGQGDAPMTITVDGYIGGFAPYLRAYTFDGELRATSSEDDRSNSVARITLPKPGLGAYFFAVSSHDPTVTGPYTVTVHQSPDRRE